MVRHSNRCALSLAVLASLGCGSVESGSAGDAAPRSDGGGGGDAGAEEGCATQFSPWFRATFELPDGGILGAADMPSSPWRPVSGSVTPQDGRARAAGTAITVASQGATLAGGALRVRYTFLATAADQEAHLLVNADANGENGLEIGIDATTGELIASENGAPLGSETLGALDIDTVYYVEALVDGDTLTATLSTDNFASVPGASLVGELRSSNVAQSTTGTFAGMRFADGGSVDEVTVSLCGVTAPTYQRLFFDDFERASGQAVGSAVEPNVAWTGDDANVRINNGMLDFTDGATVTADPGRHYSNQGLRVRASTRFGPAGWLHLDINSPSGGGLATTVDMWRQSDTEVFIEYSGEGSGSATFDLTLDTSTVYFVQFDVDGSHGVTTLRSDSFDGPVLFAFAADDIADAPNTDQGVSIGNIWSPAELSIEEYIVEQYAP
jgi:hypothetical protein